MVHNALVGGQDDETELTGGKDGVGEVFEVLDLQVKAGGDDTALVKTAVKVNDNLSSASIVDDGELSNIALLLHNAENLDEDLRDGVEDNLIKHMRIILMEV